MLPKVWMCQIQEVQTHSGRLILYLSQHVPQAAPVHSSLDVHIIQVVLHKLDTGCEISLVELVGNIPAKRTKFASLLKWEFDSEDKNKMAMN